MRSEGSGQAGVLGHCLPTLTVALTTAATVAPWRVPDFAAFGLPFLTLGAIFYWAERSAARLPSPIVFLAGLATDLVTDGPIGYWALLFLIGHALGSLAGTLADGERTISVSWLGFAVALPLIVALGWAIASLYYLTLLDIRLTLFATAAGIAGYLPLTLMLRSLGEESGNRGTIKLTGVH